ncbi:MAG: hypothetical protein JNM56_10760 [Planctomycetia bacterium]|nr:hypothetical protein [Planctomycetia bacterium]
MSEGTEHTEIPTPLSRRARASEPMLSLADDGEHNGAAVEAPPLREPSLAPDDGSTAARSTIQDLEDRIRKLEQQYAALQDTKVIEERVVQRLSNRMRRKGTTAAQTQIREAVSFDPDPLPAPPEEPAMPVARALTNETPTPAPAPVARPMEVPVAQVAMAPVAPLSSPNIHVPAPAAAPSRFAWMLTTVWILEGLNEVRVMIRMFGDPRYRLGWLNRLIPLVFLGLLIFSDWSTLTWLFPWNALPVVGWMINKLILLIFGFITFKILTREARRYQETIPDAPGAPRA